MCKDSAEKIKKLSIDNMIITNIGLPTHTWYLVNLTMYYAQDKKKYNVFSKAVVPKLRPTKTFYPALGALLKNICTHFEPQLDRIMSGIPQFHFFIFLCF